MFTDNCRRVRSLVLYLGPDSPRPRQVVTARWIYTRIIWRLYRRTKGPGMAGIAQFLKQRIVHEH